MSPSIDPALEAECQRLRQKYKVWMNANDISVEEAVSTDTANRHLKAGKYGPVDVLPGGGLRVLTANYVKHLLTRTRVFKAIA
jgi:hypothetical protein